MSLVNQESNANTLVQDSTLVASNQGAQSLSARLPQHCIGWAWPRYLCCSRRPTALQNQGRGRATRCEPAVGVSDWRYAQWPEARVLSLHDQRTTQESSTLRALFPWIMHQSSSLADPLGLHLSKKGISKPPPPLRNFGKRIPPRNRTESFSGLVKTNHKILKWTIKTIYFRYLTSD